MARNTLLASIAWLMLWLVGCGGDVSDDTLVDGDVLARVGDREFKVDDLLRFKEGAEASSEVDKEGLEALRYYLQTMVDMELLLVEAREQQLDQNPDFALKWDKEQRKKLVDEYAVRKIVSQVDLKMDEMSQRFETSIWKRTLKFAHIRLENEADAQKVMRDLEQGRPFEEVAREHSVEQMTAANGGLLEHYYGRGNLRELGMELEMAKELFELKVGQFSQPIHWGQYYEIFKIIDEAPAPAHYKTSFVRGEYWEEFQNHWKELTLELKEQFAVVLNQDTIAFLVGQMSGAERRGVMLSPAEQDMVLCSFKGGQITLKDFADTYNSLWFFRSVYFDSSGVTEFINRDILPRALVYQAALQEGIDRDPPVASWLKNKKEALLLEALRDKEVVKRVVLDSAIVRQYYESHLDQFMQFEELSVVEILLASRREAEGLLQRVQDGEDMVALAASHSIRKDVENGPLHMHDHPSERRIFGSLYDEVIQADTGVLTGPVKVDGGHSIFKVIERVDRRPVSFEKAASRAQWWLRKQEERRLFDALFVHIREKHEAKVVLFEDRLQSMAID